jgi:hypothetical protein
MEDRESWPEPALKEIAALEQQLRQLAEKLLVEQMVRETFYVRRQDTRGIYDRTRNDERRVD